MFTPKKKKNYKKNKLFFWGIEPSSSAHRFKDHKESKGADSEEKSN